MDTPVDTDSDSADERNDVLKTLTQEESTTQLVQQFLSQVRAEFALWNATYCQQVLTSFTAPSTWQTRPHPDFHPPSSAPMVVPNSISLPDVQRDTREANSLSPLVTQETYSPDGAVIETSSVKLEIVHLASSLEPHPPYESCSPLSRSVFKGDDSDNMTFIPYADDHTFDRVRHSGHYESLSWQNAFDPDLEVIVLETAYRLRIQYKLTYDEIEDCGALPLRLRSRPGSPGLLSTAQRRDPLHWAGSEIPTPYTFLPTRLGGPDFRNRLRTLNSLFCPNLSCLEPFCSVHVEPNSMPLTSQSPQLTHILSEVTHPCQNQCFMSGKMKEARPSWDEADLEMFRVISEISPNTTTCDLAELCLKPCNEVFYYRKSLYSCNSEKVQPVNVKNHRRMLRFNGKYRLPIDPSLSYLILDKHPVQFTPNDPCHHSGPCSSSSGCPCYKNQSHCQRNCLCSPECNRRWQGCRCPRSRSKWSCVTDKCPCAEAFRECDPELCINCRCIADDTTCRNSQIQRGAGKRLEVQRSSWGLGTFLPEAAKAGDLITEYAGEIIYEPTVECRSELATHRNRCYVFGLNNTYSLDATYAGNISRFIDHSDAGRSKRVNSQAQVRLVNGEHRIGIFAIRDMEAGAQVLMNYGSFFFDK